MANPTPAETLTPKLRGGYYTPPPIARFLAEWAIRAPTDTLLEPSCGDGELVEAAARQLVALGATPAQVGQQLRATELFASEAELAARRLERLGIRADDSIIVSDFFAALGGPGDLFAADAAPLAGQTFDVILGNPPFLRFQTFPEDQRQRAFAVMQQAGLKPNRLTNAWVSFLVGAALQLRSNGRLAMVIPAELLQVGYATETRAFLARYFSTVTIIAFRKLVFAGIQQEVVLLLAERGTTEAPTIDIIELDDASDLIAHSAELVAHHAHKPLVNTGEKWTLYLLEPDEIELLNILAARTDIPRMGQYASVDVGVVTGNNQFFVQSDADIRARNLTEFAVPLAGRTAQLPGMIYTPADHAAQQVSGAGCWLLRFPNIPFALLPNAAQQYIAEGERAEVHTGYKCRIRNNWHAVPSIWPSDGFLFRQIHRYPKLVANQVGATTTDTVHRVRLRQPIDIAQLAASFANVLTFAFSEVMGRSYGGGVLELEPNEADHLPVPFFADVTLDIAAMDAAERANDITTVLAHTTPILMQKLGLTAQDCQRLHAIWTKLSNRRLGRKSAPRTPRPAA